MTTFVSSSSIVGKVENLRLEVGGRVLLSLLSLELEFAVANADAAIKGVGDG